MRETVPAGHIRHRTLILSVVTLICLMVMAVVPALANADTIYVDIDFGNDLTGDGSVSNPYKHITAGMLAATSGDTVKVAEGIYSPAVGETLPIILKPGVTLQGDTSPLGLPESELQTILTGDDTGSLLLVMNGTPGTAVNGFAFYNNSSPLPGRSDQPERR